MSDLINRVDSFKTIEENPKKLISGPPEEIVIDNAIKIINLLPEDIRSLIDETHINPTPLKSVLIQIESNQKKLKIDILRIGIVYNIVNEDQSNYERSDKDAFINDVRESKNILEEVISKFRG